MKKAAFLRPELLVPYSGFDQKNVKADGALRNVVEADRREERGLCLGDRHAGLH